MNFRPGVQIVVHPGDQHCDAGGRSMKTYMISYMYATFITEPDGIHVVRTIGHGRIFVDVTKPLSVAGVVEIEARVKREQGFIEVTAQAISELPGEAGKAL